MSYGTFAYGVAAGATGAIGLVFIMIGLRRDRPHRLEISLGLFGLAAAANTLAHVQLQSADDIAEYESLIEGPFAVTGLLVIVAGSWLVAAATDVGWRRAPVLLTVGAAVVAVANYRSPGGVIVESVDALRPVSLFGEAFVLHEANTSSVRWMLDLFLVTFVSYSGYALIRSWRQGVRRLGLLGPGLGLYIVLSLFDSLIDEGYVDWAYLGPFFLMGFSMVLALELGFLIGRTERQLIAQSANMEELVTIRTRSLQEAHARIENDLVREQRNALRLSRLTRQLIELNAVAIGPAGETDDLERALSGAVASLGEMVEARSVDLAVTGLMSGSTELGVGWVREARDDDGSIDVAQRSWPLRVGEVDLGTLTIAVDEERELRVEQQQLAALTAEYVAATLKRVELEEAQLASAVDDERQRIARELHDSVSQRLYSAAFQAEALSNRDDGNLDDYRETASQVRNLVLTSMAEMRTLLFELQPAALDGNQLTTLVEQLCESLSLIHARPIEVATQPGPVLPPGPKLALYRVAQEAIGNALRHSEAANIVVSVTVSAEFVELTVADDGVGFEAETMRYGHGLRNIESRARQIGASLAVEGVPGQGTIISVSWKRGADADTTLDLRAPMEQGVRS